MRVMTSVRQNHTRKTTLWRHIREQTLIHKNWWDSLLNGEIQLRQEIPSRQAKSPKKVKNQKIARKSRLNKERNQTLALQNVLVLSFQKLQKIKLRKVQDFQLILSPLMMTLKRALGSTMKAIENYKGQLNEIAKQKVFQRLDRDWVSQ